MYPSHIILDSKICKFSFKILSIFLIFFLFLFGKTTSIYAETTPYHSAGWVGTTGYTAYSSVTGCQASSDGLYCSRPYADFNGELYFGSFGNLEDFGVPLNSYIDKLRIRVKGKATTDQNINVVNEYNQKNISYFCQTSPNLPTIYLGPNDNTIEISKPIVIGDGFAYCFTRDNINFRNLTFQLKAYPSSKWSADIDNFEIAFDYTPPAVTPTPVVFPENQKGTVWEIGPDKLDLKLVVGLENLVSVVTGSGHSLALKSDGTIWAWGRNQEGQLGNGNSEANVETPAQVKGPNGLGYLTGVKKITAGAFYSMALKKDGTIWIWGSNSYGFLGTGGGANDSGNKLLFPTQVISGYFTNPVDIAAGDNHSLVLNSDGTVVGWGQNNNGQIGNGCFLYNCSSVLYPTPIQNVNNIVAISAGYAHSLALKNDGTIWGWGASGAGQLGETIMNISNVYSERPNSTKIAELGNLKTISTKGNYNLAIGSDGKLIEWGNGISIPKQIPEFINVLSMSAGSSGFSYGVKGHVLKSDGTLWQLYINDIPPKQVPVLKNVVAVASGNQTASLAVVNTGDVLGTSISPTPSPKPTPTLTPTPEPGPSPFLQLPFDYAGKSFEQVALNPESWFDHKYPLQNVPCCTFKVLKYTGSEDIDAYRSHSGYDYAKNNGIVLGTQVFAAASGSAEFEPASKSNGGGNVIKIDHGNGYQTWYEHLSIEGLIVDKENLKVKVDKGQEIGKVGMTGNTNGPHLHLSVFNDVNNNGTFNDDYPYGLLDPLGWEPQKDLKDRDPDPWTLYGATALHGAASYQLFTAQAKPKLQFIPKATGGVVQTDDGKIGIYIPSDVSPSDLTVKFKYGPFESANDLIKSVSPSFFINAFNNLGDKVTNFFKSIKIVYYYHEADLSNINQETLKMYYYNADTSKWEQVPATFDKENKIVTLETSHFSHFALMGEIKDNIAPVTDIVLSGDKGQDNRYRSNINAELKGKDNEGGIGLQYTLFTLTGNDWDEYKEPLVFDKEGDYSLSYQSFDKANNKEERKNIKFNIDKTAPSTTVNISGILGQEGWYTSNIAVTLNASDNKSGIAKTEYSLDSGESYQTYSSEFAVTSEGNSIILFRSIDKAGNLEESKKLELKIDKTAPSTVVYSTGTKGQNNWYITNVQIALNGKDDISGLKTSYYSLNNQNFIEYSNPIIFDHDGLSKVYYYSIDNAGNKEDVKDFEVKIDKTPPVVSIAATPSSIWPPNGKMVNVKITGSSNDSNLLSTKFNVKDEYDQLSPDFTDFGQTIQLQASRKGNDVDGRVYEITAIAEDLAGNKGYAIIRVTVPHDQEK